MFLKKILSNTFIKGNLWVGIGNLLLSIKGIVLIPLLIKNLGTSEYGYFALLITSITLTFNISPLGTGYKYKRYMPSVVDIEDKRKMFYSQFIFQLFALFLFVIFLIFNADFINKLIFKQEVHFSTYLIYLLLFSNFLCYQTGSYFRLTHRLKYFSITQAGVPYLEILFILAILIFHGTLTIDYVLISNIAAYLLLAIPFFIKMVKEIGFKIYIYNWDELINEIKFGSPLILGLIVDFCLSMSDRYIIAFFMSSHEVGLYNPAYALGTLMRFIPSIYIYVMPVFLSKYIDSGKEHDSKTIIDRSVFYFLILSVPFAVGCAVYGKIILEIFANKEVANMAYLVMPVVALGTIFYGINIIIGEVLFIKLKTKTIFFVNAFSAILNIILNIIFIAIFRNIVVAAVTTFLCYLLSFIILSYKVRPFINISYRFSRLVKVCIASVCMGVISAVLLSVISHNMWEIILTILASLLIYIFLLYVLNVINKKELVILPNN